MHSPRPRRKLNARTCSYTSQKICERSEATYCPSAPGTKYLRAPLMVSGPEEAGLTTHKPLRALLSRLPEDTPTSGSAWVSCKTPLGRKCPARTQWQDAHSAKDVNKENCFKQTPADAVNHRFQGLTALYPNLIQCVHRTSR